MTDLTARLHLPLMAAGQAQKEVTHNEALLLIDSLVAPRCEAPPQNLPPTGPAEGQCWLVGPAPGGAWTGQAHRLASWTAAGWRFAEMPFGARVTLAGGGTSWSRISTGWQIAPTVAAPSGGGVADVECRSAVSAIISALVAAGLLAA